MHQKNKQAAQPSSAALHDDDDDDDDEDNADPFRDGEDDIDDDDVEGDAPHERVRGSWWRGVVRSRGKAGGDDSDDADDDDEEFGDFAMAEDDKGGDGADGPNVLLRPLAVHPAKESSRGLSGLWPFGSRGDRDKDKNKHEGDKEDPKDQVVVPALSEKREDDKRAVEVKEATSRTSIEEPDEEEVVVGAEALAGGS